MEGSITEEERLRIAQFFLVSSPPCQFTEVSNDVASIVGEEALTVDAIARAAATYNNTNGRVVTLPSGVKVPICEAAKIKGNIYADPNSMYQTFSVDHFSLQTSSAEAIKSVSSIHEATRAAIHIELAQYTRSHFSPEQTAFGAYIRQNSSDGYTAVLISENPNLKNFWAGKWFSYYSVRIEEDRVFFSGEVKILAHYFEDGNMQLQTNKSVTEREIAISAPEDLPILFARAIKEEEDKVRSGIENIFVRLNSEVLRSIRRTMPVTGTMMEWNINSVRMAQAVRRSHRATLNRLPYHIVLD